MTKVYVFIDESGNPSTSDCYTLAGVWCLTEYDDPSEILKPVRDQLANRVVNVGSELKGEMLTDAKLNSCLYFTRKAIENDSSVVSTDVWQTNRPVAFTLYDSDSDTGRTIAEQHLGESANATVTAQLLALASVTSPCLRLDEHSAVELSDRRIILDGNTWRRAGASLSAIYRSLAWTPRIEFSLRDSRNTPGIQLADLVAHARRRRLDSGDCSEAVNVINELRL